MTEPGRFTEGFRSARRMLASADDKLRVFENVALEFAGYVERGLDKIVAVDELQDIAIANGLDDTDLVQSITARAFNGIEQEAVPDELVAPAWTITNGHDTPPPLGEWDAGDAPGTIPPRAWLLGNQFCRRFISSLVAAGGTGKSALRLLQFISMATGRELCGQHIFRRARVLLISLEDDRNELQRRIEAILRHYEIPRTDLKGWLFCSSPSQMAKLAVFDRKHDRHIGLLEAQIREAVQRLQPDIVSLDPFVKTHGLEENSSGDMDFVCDLLAKLSVEFNIAVDSPHHVAKGLVLPGNADAGRGSSGIRDAARLVFTLCTMSQEESETFGVSPERRRFFVRLDPAKLNIAAPAMKATWFELVGVPINNGDEIYPSGDTIQVAQPWSPPALWDVSSEVLNRVLDDIAKGLDDGRRYSNAPAATDRQVWPVVQQHCTDKTEAQCRQIIGAWLDSGLLFPDDYDDPLQRRKRKGLFVNDAKRPT